MARRGAKAAALLAATVFWGWGGGAAAGEIATVAKSGDPAPGTGGATFPSSGGFNSPAINGAGQVAFFGGLEGSGVTAANNQGIWVGAPGALALAARHGFAAPGAGGALFDNLDNPALNGAGTLAFFGLLTGSGVTTDVNDHGIWAGPPGGLDLAARRGAVAPDAGGAVFSDLSDFDGDAVFNGAGELAFRAELTGSGVTSGVNDEGIWVGKPGALAMAARTGNAAPGIAGAVFENVGDQVMNGAGELAFSGTLTGGGVTAANDRGIWVGSPGGFVLAARTGQSAPGAAGTVFSSIASGPSLNAVGEVAFRAFLSGSGATPGVDDRGVWAGAPGSLALVARRGDLAPGAGGAVFESFTAVLLNRAGTVVFRAFLTGGGVTPGVDDRGIWAGAPGSLALVARAGDPAPGTGGLLFDGDSFFFPFLNGAGELAFRAFLTGGGVTNANDLGLWAGSPGSLQLIVREGDAIEVAPGLSKTVSNLSVPAFAGTEDGRRSAISEGGQVAFSADFTDNSEGIFVSPPDAPTVHLLPDRPVDGAWDQVILPRSFKKPVIIAGPPGSANKQPGVVRLREIEGAEGRFEARFQEWRYLDGPHPEERTDFLALEKGRHKQADGSIWEAGSVKLKGNRKWKKKKFAKRFRRPPQVFATVQSFKGRTAVAARVRNVTKKGFEVSIQEEEKDLSGRHPKETVGYLAVFSRRGQGMITGGVNGTDYSLKRTKLKHRFKTVPGGALKLEEEKSKDKERRHKKESVSTLSLGRGLFAQQASDKEVDTTAIRRR